VINPLDNYSDACTYLDDLQMHKIKLGLEAMRSALNGLGSPEQQCPVAHVAGTNGKGSVCSMLQTTLTAAGYRTGLYTSPHLSSVRERFRIDDSYISKEDFTRLMGKIRTSLAGDMITYFECTTALAFSWFAENNCDLVILETGMGGRLDATNVVTPLLSVITTISLDHEQYLGNTLEAVAYEKAGIIKPDIPVISGVIEDPAATVIEKIANERNAPLQIRNKDFRMEPGKDERWIWQSTDGSARIEDLQCGKNGAWQVNNSGCAVAAAISLRESGYKIPDQAIRTGISETIWPGRMESLKVGRNAQGSLRFLLDGAHNPAGVSFLIDALQTQFHYDRLLVIWASMGDKDYSDMLREMEQQADVLLLTRPQSERAAFPADLAAALAQPAGEKVQLFDTVSEAIDSVFSQATGEDLVVVAGSLYLVGEFRHLLVGEVV
jgi:dihydrofolate synthase/folylpolyglutamate synthase